MCCIVANIFKIVNVVFSIFCLFGVSVMMLNDLSNLLEVGSVQEYDNYARNTTWMLHCFCGNLMTVLRLKDQCFLYWWQLMTLAFLVGGFFINYLQPDIDGFGIGEKVANYFMLEYMLFSLLAVASYTRALRSQEEV